MNKSAAEPDAVSVPETGAKETGHADRQSVSPFSILFSAFLGLLLLAYPFLIYWGITRFDPRWIAAVLLGIYLLRLLTLKKVDQGASKRLAPMFAAVAVTLLATLAANDGMFLLINPFLINVVFLVCFGHSLWRPPSMIERFARLKTPNLPVEAVSYCRKLTIVWCCFFALNGAISLATVLSGSLSIWALYNGLISYLLIGTLFAIELIVRKLKMGSLKPGGELDRPL